MSLIRAQVNYGGNLIQPQSVGDVLLTQRSIATDVTAGASTITAAALTRGILRRTGPGAGFTDTFPSADSLLLAESDLNVGDAFEFTYINGVAFAMTAAAGEGCVLGSNVSVAASAIRKYLISILGTGPRQVFQATTTNANATLTGVPTAIVSAVQPGQGLSGTGIAAGAYVLSVNPVAGTITMSANATASATVAVTSFPRYQVEGLFAGTA